MNFLQYLHALAAQHPNGATAATPVDLAAQIENPLWPYWVAITTMATVITALFGLLMKSNRDRTVDARDHAEETKQANKAFLEATEERSKRVSEEFSKKDKALLDTSVEFAKLMERVANELARMNDGGR